MVLLGQRGAGTNFVARLLHETSARASGPFIAQQCGLYPRHTLEAEFFGRISTNRSYIRTARGASPGRIAAAAGGTLFIDQIQNTTPRIQAELVGLLAESQYHDAVNGDVRAADVRLVVSIRPDVRLDVLARAGKFNKQLLKYLQRPPVAIPRACNSSEIFLDTIDFLCKDIGVGAHAPAEVVALRQAVRQAMLNHPSGATAQRILYAAIRNIRSTIPAPVVPVAAAPETLDQLTYRLQQALIEQTLARCNGIQAKAAELLGLSRAMLNAKILELGLASRALSAA
jgi:DNA-binding NtrC family response regulator